MQFPGIEILVKIPCNGTPLQQPMNLGPVQFDRKRIPVGIPLDQFGNFLDSVANVDDAEGLGVPSAMPDQHPELDRVTRVHQAQVVYVEVLHKGVRRFCGQIFPDHPEVEGIQVRSLTQIVFLLIFQQLTDGKKN